MRVFGNAGASVVPPDDPLGLAAAGPEEGLTAAAMAQASELFLKAFADELVRLRYAAPADVAVVVDEHPGGAGGARCGSASGAFAAAAKRMVRVARRAVARDVRPHAPVLRRLVAIVRARGGEASVAELAEAILADVLVPVHLRTGFGRGDGRYPLLFFEHGLVFRPTGVQPRRVRR